MGMVVRTNIMAMNANRQLGMNNNQVSKSLEKLSSGFKINRAGDDASGLAISEKMKAQIKGLEQASANSQDGISLVQTAEGALTEVHSMLNRMVELATKSANGTIQDEVDREAIQSEVDALLAEVDRISQSTNFNGINLLDGSMGLNTKAFTVGSTAAGTDAVKGAAIGGAFTLGTDGADVAGTNTIEHVDGVAAKKTQFSFDLDGVSFKSGGDADNVFKLTVGGVEIALDAAAQNTTLSGEDLATALKTKIDAGQLGTSGVNGEIKIKNHNYTVERDGTKLIFTMKADPTAAATAGDLTGNFTVATGSDGTSATVQGTINTGSQVITAGQKPQAATLANTVASVDFAKFEDGAEMTVGGQTVVLAIGADSKYKDAANAVDLSDLDLAQAGDKTLALDRLTLAFEDNEMFTVGHDATGKLTFQEKSDYVATGDVDLTTKEGIEAQITLSKASTAAKGAGTKLDIDVTKLKAGNSLNIDGTTYNFVETATGAANEVVLGANGANALANLSAALTANGHTVDTNGTELTIRAKTAAGAAPAIIGGGLTLQIGDTGDAFNMVRVTVGDMSSAGLGIAGLDVSNADAARNSIDTIKDAINTVSTNRADMGALQNRLEYTINNLDVASENMTAANSRIRDTDMAKEMMEYTKTNVLTQAAQAMLAQANQQPQSILQLLQ